MLAPAYLGLLVFILFFEIIRTKSSLCDFLTFFNISFSLIYPLPAFLLEADFGHSRAKLMYGSELYTSNIQIAIAIFAGYFLVILGFYAKSSEDLGRNIFIRSSNKKILTGYAVVLLLLSCLSIQVYSAQYGGFTEALSKSILIRSNAVESGSLVFFKHFIMISCFSSYILLSLFNSSKNTRNRFFLFTTFLLSVVISIIASTLTAGRSNIIKYIFTFAFAYVVQAKKISWKYIIPSVCIFPLVTLYGKSFFFSLSALPNGYNAVAERFLESLDEQSNEESNFYEFLANLVFPFHSLNAALEKQYQLRLFSDFFYGIVAFLPERLLGIENLPKAISSDNTEYLVGTVDYGIPPGFLAFGIYSMSWPGLIIVCFIFGWIGRCIQTILYSHLHKLPWIPFIYALTAQVWVDFTTSGDPEVFLIGNFWFLIAIFLFLKICCKFSIFPPDKQKTSGSKKLVG